MQLFVVEIWDCCTSGSQTAHCRLDSVSSAVPFCLLGGPAVLVHRCQSARWNPARYRHAEAIVTNSRAFVCTRWWNGFQLLTADVRPTSTPAQSARLTMRSGYSAGKWYSARSFTEFHPSVSKHKSQWTDADKLWTLRKKCSLTCNHSARKLSGVSVCQLN